MKIIYIDNKNNSIKLIPETYDDIWHLSHIIEVGDRITIRTHRTYKPNETAKPVKKPVTLVIEAEKIDFRKEMKRLRILGKIVGGRPEEFVQLGSYHSAGIEFNEPIKIEKKKLSKHIIEKLKDAVRQSKKPIIGFVLLDDEKSLCAVMKVQGIDIIAEIYSNTSKRDTNREEKMKKYMNEIVKIMENMNVDKFIVAGPGFVKDDFKDILDKKYPDLAKKVWMESCSYVEPNGIEELIKKDVVSKVIGEHQQIEESKWMEKVSESLGKDDGKVTYGREEVNKAISYGMVSDILVSVKLIHEDEIKTMLNAAEKKHVKIHIFSDESLAGKKLLGLGGLVAILYYSNK
ncbi:mRNA surveillance protein pelota [Candidatus Micrarchaeota archaeon]|nr:mRNA surveillance protein pelota [Candidatus Micrarchaeota archaeon]